MAKRKQAEIRQGTSEDYLEALSCIHNLGIDIEFRELWLTPVKFSEDGNSPDVEKEMAIRFERNLRFLNQGCHDTIVIHMHCLGGDWSDCLGIYDSIRFSESPTVMIVYGEASSASGIILQAPDLRVMMPHASLMIHSGSLHFGGTGEDLETTARWSRKQYSMMLDLFAARSKTMDQQQIDTAIKQHRDWYMMADETIANGFADVTLGSPGYETISAVKALKIAKVPSV